MNREFTIGKLRVKTWRNKPHGAHRRVGIQVEVITKITTGIYIDYWVGQRVIRLEPVWKKKEEK